ncbi:hypothetical protein H0H93_010720 [Arthromyces matolae]|nr:hypothetical protein H0H93_010720 [Arthromyces matolae]
MMDSRCRPPPPGLIRRDDSNRITSINDSLERFFTLGDEHMTERINILTSQAWVVFKIMDTTVTEPSPELKATATVAHDKLSEFVGTRPFQNMIGMFATKALGHLLIHLQIINAEPHSSAVTPVVLQWLQREDISMIFSGTLQALVAASEIVNLLHDPNASLDHPDPLSPNGVYTPTKYLPKYRYLLLNKNYVRWPGDDNVDDEIINNKSNITGILLRYSDWAKSKDKNKLVDLKKRFEDQLKQKPQLPPSVRVVLKAYLWALSDGRL